MKKTMTMMICAALLLSFAACGGGGDDTRTEEKPGDAMTPDEIVSSILEDVENLPAVENITLTESNFENFLFIDYIDGAQAVASEALITAVAHSVVVLRLPEGADTDAVADEIRDNADSFKWICVGAEKTVVEARGQTVLLVMSTTETADAVAENFSNLWAG